MQRVVVHRPGSYERLEIEQAGNPLPAPGEVVVRAEAIGVNYADCVVRMGLYESARRYVGWPITPGFELAGTIDALGPDTEGFALGDKVLAVTRFGGYATHVAVPKERIFRVPSELPLTRAAAFPAVFLTAWYALCELSRLRPGMRLLVHSAAGGVGGALVQLGKLSGCRVVGVVGARHKLEHVRQLGADAVIDKSREPLWERARAEAPDGYDVVLDANGPETLRGSYRLLRPSGRLVIYGFHGMLPKSGGRPSLAQLALGWLRMPRFSPLRLTGDNKSVLGFNLSYLFDETELLEQAMGELLGWLSAGKLQPPEVTEYPFERVRDAHRDLESGRTVGKLVLVPRP